MVEKEPNDETLTNDNGSKKRERRVFKEASPGDLLTKLSKYREYIDALESKLQELDNETGGEATTMKGVTAFHEIGKALGRALNGVSDTLTKKQLGGDV